MLTAQGPLVTPGLIGLHSLPCLMVQPWLLLLYQLPGRWVPWVWDCPS